MVGREEQLGLRRYLAWLTRKQEQPYYTRLCIDALGSVDGQEKPEHPLSLDTRGGAILICNTPSPHRHISFATDAVTKSQPSTALSTPAPRGSRLTTIPELRHAPSRRLTRCHGSYPLTPPAGQARPGRAVIITVRCCRRVPVTSGGRWGWGSASRSHRCSPSTPVRRRVVMDARHRFCSVCIARGRGKLDR
jgi:hypothetical protein